MPVGFQLFEHSFIFFGSMTSLRFGIFGNL